MKKLLPLVALVLFALPAVAQERTAVELFMGYSHLNADLYGFNTDIATGFSLGDERRNAPGWKGGASIPINDNLSIDVEGAGNYKKMDISVSSDYYGTTITTRADVLVSDYTVFVDPRVNLGIFYLRAMFGGDFLHYKTAEIPMSGNVTDSEWSMAGSFGGGVKVPMTRRLSFRAGLDYEISRHNLFGMPPTLTGDLNEITAHYRLLTQNNFSVSAGIVYNLFKKAR